MKPQIVHRYTIPLQTVIEQLIGKEATNGEGFIVDVDGDDLVVDIIEPAGLRSAAPEPTLEPTFQEKSQGSEADEPSNEAEKINTSDKPKGGALAQRAGMICGERVFPKFVTETYGVHFQPPAVDHVAIWLRSACGVESRAELDHNDTAGAIFREIESKFRLWLDGW